MHSWNLLDYPAVLPLQQVIRPVEAPMRTSACEHEVPLICLQRASLAQSFVVWPASDPYHNLTCPCSPFNPDPQTLCCSSILRQSSTHSSWLLTERTTPPLFLLCLSFLKSLYTSIPGLESQEPSHHVAVMPVRSQHCRYVHIFFIPWVMCILHRVT